MAAYAQSNANKCFFSHADLAIPGYEGLMLSENMVGGIPGASAIEDEDLKAAFLVQFSMKDYDTWMNEVKYFTYPSTCQDGKVCGHYSTVIRSFILTVFIIYFYTPHLYSWLHRITINLDEELQSAREWMVTGRCPPTSLCI